MYFILGKIIASIIFICLIIIFFYKEGKILNNTLKDTELVDYISFIYKIDEDINLLYKGVLSLIIFIIYIILSFLFSVGMIFIYPIIVFGFIISILLKQRIKNKTKMKNLKALVLVFSLLLFSSCTTVDSGHKGVMVSWGGETNLTTVYPEGMLSGLHWIWDDMVEYDVREKTLKQKYQFNDKNNMTTGVELALDYYPNPSKVALLHVKIGKENVDIKIEKTLQSAAKEVIPQYTASELNLYKRNEAEQKLSDVLRKELPEFFIEFARVQLTDVDIPEAIASAAEQTAKQLELNKLADSKAVEAEMNYKAAEWDAKTKSKLSEPAMLKLQQVQNERLMWEGFLKHGKSPYGQSNMFGSLNGISILKTQ